MVDDLIKLHCGSAINQSFTTLLMRGMCRLTCTGMHLSRRFRCSFSSIASSPYGTASAAVRVIPAAPQAHLKSTQQAALQRSHFFSASARLFIASYRSAKSKHKHRPVIGERCAS